MATKKTTTIKKSSVTVNGSDSTSVVDVMKVYGNSNRVNARKGNDQITVYKGQCHTISGGAGNDTILLSATDGGNDLYGNEGNDTITVKGGDLNWVYGGTGNDKIYVKAGTRSRIYGQNGADRIFLYTGQHIADGGTGNDIITVSGGNKHSLRGGKGSDKYVVSSSIVKATRLTINQVDYVSKDADTLNLKKVNQGDIKFCFNSGKSIFTITHNTGGVVTVKNWTKNPLSQVLFANGRSYRIIAGKTTRKLTGTSGDDYIMANHFNTTVKGGAGNDVIDVSGGSGSSINGGSGADTIMVNFGSSLIINGDSGADVIRIKDGSGHAVNTGTGNDKVYVTASSARSIVNSGGTDYIEIGKNAGNGIKVESVGSGTVGYGLVAKETVKVLGGNNHDIRLYGGNDKVVVAGGSGHVVYTDGPTGKGDAGGNDIIVIQDGGAAKKVVAGNGNDVIAVANGAGNNSTIYTGLEDPNGKNSGAGENTLNLLGGSGHTVYLGGTKNTVLVEAQDVTLNKYAGTVDDITVRWSEEGTGTLRINCPSVSSSAKSTLHLEGVNSFDFDFKFDYVDVKNANGVVSEKPKALIMEFGGDYTRDTRVVTIATRYVSDDAGNTNLPVYVNGNGVVQYNWCAGNEQFNYDKASVAGGAIEITRWDSMQPFTGITFDNGTYTQAQITTAANNNTKLW